MSKFSQFPKQSFLLQSRDNKRAVSFFSNLSNDFFEIRFLLAESSETVILKNEVELNEIDYSEVLVLHVRDEKKLDFLEVAYRFIETGIIQIDGLTVFSGL